MPVLLLPMTVIFKDYCMDCPLLGGPGKPKLQRLNGYKNTQAMARYSSNTNCLMLSPNTPLYQRQLLTNFC